MYAVEVENLTKVYGSGDSAVTALRDASMQVKPGELAAILGPSGSGKTTLLTAIGLINEPTRGRISLGGVCVANNGWQPGLDLKRLRREQLGFIFQAHNLIPFLTAIENVLVALNLNGITGKSARNRAEELLSALNLAERS